MISQSQFNTSIIPFTLQYEGGYANVSGDKGGETYRGITRKNWPNWSGWATVDRVRPKHNQIIPELESAVKAFYFTNYFKSKGFDKINSVKVAAALFDFAVHGGYSCKKLQQILNSKFNAGLTIDGGMGASTITAINKANADQLAALIMAWRENHLTAIVDKDPTQQKFYNGWMNRLKSLTGALSIIRKNPVTTFIALAVIGLILYYFIIYKKGQNSESMDKTDVFRPEGQPVI